LRRLLTAILAVLAIQSVASYANAITIVPGKYPLEWGDITPFIGGWFISLEKMTPAVAKGYTGLHSTETYWGRQGKVTVVVDKTNPHGNYDVAYIITARQGKAAVDLRAAVRQSLQIYVDDQQQVSLYPTEEQPRSLQWTMGTRGSEVTKTLLFSISVHLEPDAKGRQRPATASFELRNGWVGTVKTDAGDLRVSSRDSNGNGVYGDRMLANDAGDSVLLNSPTHEFPTLSDAKELDLGEAVVYKGKLYIVKMSTCGDSIEFQPYAGPTGTLVVSALDARNKPTDQYSVKLFNDRGLYDYTAGEAVTVPAGKYTASVFIDDKRPWSEQNHLYSGIRASMRGKLNLAAGSTINRRFGGPMKLSIEPESKLIKAKPGQKLDIWLFLDIGGDEFGVTSMTTPKVTISNSAGKMVNKGDGYWGCVSGGAGYIFSVPRDWKPGLYKIVATLDPRPYQQPVVAGKLLEIVR
jgi:hypothetical protein